MKSSNAFHRFSRILLFAILTFASVNGLRADILELTNGDHYRGKVISMSETQLEFLSEIQGKVKIPRDKVVQITFKEIKKTVTVAPVVGAPLILSGPAAAPAVAPTGTAESVVQQMRVQGVDPAMIKQIQEQVFGKGSPEASKKFDEMMGSLMNGSMSVQDVQKMAQSSIDQIKDAKKDLGGDAGEMLDGYLTILQNFVNQANAESNASKPATPAAGAKASPTDFSASTHK